ncbi:Hypothetical predicted protein [Podarcis lilfordi]|uniref:Uncharacterized protein n=1 Tax=Podarcis lilfordi TaxID=74358 RepID=A0AA35LNW3_9SAUR|nr:Hypothetical predicted protein [Podarcis lilfordi]
MAWQQALPNPIPQFDCQLQIAQDAAPSPPRTRKRGNRNGPVTWGQIKSLSFQAEQLRKEKQLEATPDNLLLCLISCLNINSMIVLIFSVLFLPLSASALNSGGSTPINVWESFAKTLNVSSFCLTQQVSIGEILGSCLIPVCHDPFDIQNDTWFYSSLPQNDSLRTLGYSGYHTWGTQVHRRPPLAIDLLTPYVASFNVTCARMVSCTITNCVKMGKDNFNCSNYVNISYVYKYTELPEGWFWSCPGYTFNYIPANISHGTPCCLSRLSIILPKKHHLSCSRYRRSVELTNDCDDSVSLPSRSEYISLAVSLLGVPGLAVRNSMNINSLACSAAKALNFTSQALHLLNKEQSELHHGLLQNRAAIDYLLMLHHYGCEQVNDMCCFNITDNSKAIQKQISHLQNLTHHIKQDVGFSGLWDSFAQWLTGWLPHLNWLRNLFQYAIVIICILILLCCFIQCIPGLMRLWSQFLSPPQPPNKIIAAYFAKWQHQQ